MLEGEAHAEVVVKAVSCQVMQVWQNSQRWNSPPSVIETVRRHSVVDVGEVV